MVEVTLSLDADLAVRAIQQSEVAGMDLRTFLVRSLQRALISSDVLRVVQNGTPAESFQSWMEEAVARAAKVATGQEFKLQDLFAKDEWRAIPSHTAFGREFRKQVEGPGLASHIGKTPVNEAIYRRT